jgi:2'-5' RNA ligase
VEIAEEVKDSLQTAINRLRDRIEVVAPRARVSWTRSDRIHLTIRFIGEVGPEAANAVIEALRPPLAIDPFAITVAGTGVFPSSGPPRVVWAGIVDGVEPLGLVERQISSRLETLGVPRESRPFRPHLTLARVRVPGGLRGPALLEGTQGEAFGSSRVEETALFESRLANEGPTHITLVRTRLVIE